jgi:superoxide reductase
MTKRFEIYKCQTCQNIVEILREGDGTMTCCGKDMLLVKENTTDAAKEKHVPVVAKSDHGITAKVGEVAHPMEEKHFIEWIQVIAPDGTADRKFLKPGQAPEAVFCCADTGSTVREYCNLHGLWKK